MNLDALSSIDSEKAMLGGVLIAPDMLPHVRSIVNPDDLYILRYQLVYRAMLDVADEGLPVDMLTVAERLRLTGKLDAIGGEVEIARLANAVPTSMHTEFYARMVLAAAQRRALVKYADGLRDMAFDGGTNVQQVMSNAEHDLNRLLERRMTREAARSAQDIVQDHFDLIEQATESGDYTPERFRLHVNALQDIMRGYRPQCVYTFAARPGVGKSSYLHNEAAHLACQMLNGRRVLLYSLEMSELQVIDGLVGARARLNVQAISDRKLRPDHMRLYSRAAGEVARLPMDIDCGTRYWEDMAAEVRTRARIGSLSAVLIDYVGLVKTRKGFKGDGAVRQRFDYIMAEAKALAMETGATIIFAAQFNRSGDGAPALVHLKESGGLEEHSDAVIGIHRDMDDATVYANAVQRARLIVLKHRYGPLGAADVGYYGAFKLFVDLKREVREHAAD